MYEKIKDDSENFRLNDIYKDIHNFCNTDLSAFYFDIRKDTLYCASIDSLERRSYRTVLDILFNSLTTWLAPILCFTSEEAWQTRYNDPKNSVHIQDYFYINKDLIDLNLSQKWDKIRDFRLQVTNALEEKRKTNEIGSSLDAKIILNVNEETGSILENLDLSEIFICSEVVLNIKSNKNKDDIEIFIEKAEGMKCERCWKISTSVDIKSKLCPRCKVVFDSKN